VQKLVEIGNVGEPMPLQHFIKQWKCASDSPSTVPCVGSSIEVHDQDMMFKYQAGQRRSVKHLDKLVAGEAPGPLLRGRPQQWRWVGASPRSSALGQRAIEDLLAVSLGATRDPDETIR
jgi:hypothetical protein